MRAFSLFFAFRGYIYKARIFFILSHHSRIFSVLHNSMAPNISRYFIMEFTRATLTVSAFWWKWRVFHCSPLSLCILNVVAAFSVSCSVLREMLELHIFLFCPILFFFFIVGIFLFFCFPKFCLMYYRPLRYSSDLICYIRRYAFW